MASSVEDPEKPMPVITDISQRAIRERNPDDPNDPENLEQQQNYYDESDSGRPRRKGKKGRYGSYASAIRATDGAQSDLMRRKEKYAAALEGARIDDDDLDEFYKDTGINPDEPDIMSTMPLGKIKQQYLSTAKEEGKVVPPTEERPEPHQLRPAWPPMDESDGAVQPKVIDIAETDDKPKRDGVDAGHVESVNILKERWNNIPEKYRNKPLGVNKPVVGITTDNKWIKHYKPVIDEGEAPDDPEWLKMVRHRRWMSTVKARFPEDEKERVAFEKRSTTPRKLKKPNPYTVMRSTVDIDSEFDDVMRRRRKHSDNYEEGAYLTKSQTSFVKSASSFRSEATDFTDAGRSPSLTKTPVQGPIKEYLKNLSLERARGSMLKWAFSADVVDEPYRYDLPKPIDLLIMEDLERDNEWKYEQARRRFIAENGVEGLSIQSASQASFMSEDGLHETDGPHKHLDETAGFIPKLTDIQKKLQDEVVNKPIIKSSALEEEAKVLPKVDEIKEKMLEPESDETTKKKPFSYEDEGALFSGIKDVAKQLPKGEEPPKELIMPTTVLKEPQDFKKIMQDRKTAADESAIDRAESAAQDIKTLASDISKTFDESTDKHPPKGTQPKEESTPKDADQVDSTKQRKQDKTKNKESEETANDTSTVSK